MIKVYQDKVVQYDNEGNMIVRGNCFPAVIASIMEIPLNQVPNIEELYFIVDGFWHLVLLTWLNAKGWCITMVTEDYIKDHDDYYLVTGKSPRGDFNHVVIYKNGVLVHDPYPEGTGIDGEISLYEVLEKY